MTEEILSPEESNEKTEQENFIFFLSISIRLHQRQAKAPHRRAKDDDVVLLLWGGNEDIFGAKIS